MILSPLQKNEYDCAIGAIRYLCAMYKIPKGLYPKLESVAGTTKEFGTSHEGVKDVIKFLGLQAIEMYGDSIENVPLFSIVNYQWDKDGHYGVVVSKTTKDVFIYNPYNGNVDKYKIAEFNKRFYSVRYGAMWSLYVVRL